MSASDLQPLIRRPAPPEFRVEQKGDLSGPFDLYLRLHSLLDILRHVPEAVRYELGGLLLGEIGYDEQGAFMLVERALPALQARSSRASITFTPEVWDGLWTAKERECPQSRVVGWYHTHPALGVFLSEQDCFIHRHFFKEAFQLALVFDPATFVWGVFRWEQDTLALAPGFFVYAEVGSSTPELDQALREMDPAWIILLGPEE